MKCCHCPFEVVVWPILVRLDRCKVLAGEVGDAWQHPLVARNLVHVEPELHLGEPGLDAGRFLTTLSHRFLWSNSYLVLIRADAGARAASHCCAPNGLKPGAGGSARGGGIGGGGPGGGGGGICLGLGGLGGW